jgi:hypothetical protein
MKSIHCLHSRIVGLLFLFGFPLAGQPAGNGPMPFHQLDPYPVEARDESSAAWRQGLHAEGRVLLEPGRSARSGSWIGAPDLEGFAVARIEDVFGLVPGAAIQARFGVITVPTIRGDAAGTLFNGQRRGDNLFGLPPGFAAVESIEVINGSPVLSAGLGKRTGGLLNLISLRPVPGEDFGSLSFRLGTWVPSEGDYRTLEGTLERNIPLGQGSALRMVLGLRDDQTFYHANGGRDDFRDLYLAWRSEADDGGVLDLIFQYQESDRPQNLGVNRPWQGLVDNGSYPTGGVSVPDIDPETAGPLAPGLADPGLIAAGAEDLVKLPRDRVLMSLGDIGRGEALLGQLIWKRPLGTEWLFHQHLLVERVDREKRNQFYYAEAVEQLTVDSISRLEWTGQSLLGPVRWESGLHLRLEDRDNRANYWNEFAYAFDITAGRRFPALDRFAANVAPGAVSGSDGWPWYLPSSGFSTPETTRSRIRQAGLFSELRQEFGGGWAIETRLRLDWLEAEASEPADLVPEGGWTDRESVPLLSGSASLVREWESGSVYLTAGLFRGMAGNTVGDGLNLYPPGRLNREDLLNRSRLLEVGASWRPAERLTLRATLFDQRRRRSEFFGSSDIEARGLEAELLFRVAPGSRLRVTGHYLDAHYVDAAPAEFGGGSLWNVYAEGAGPTGEGNGLGYIGGFFLNSLPPGDYRLPGLSRWQVQAALEQSLAERLTLYFRAAWSGPQNGNLAGEYEIPAQTEGHLTLVWEPEPWTLSLTLRNLWDAENWIHNGDPFFDQMLLSRNLPFRVEGRIRFAF